MSLRGDLNMLRSAVKNVLDADDRYAEALNGDDRGIDEAHAELLEARSYLQEVYEGTEEE